MKLLRLLLVLALVLLPIVLAGKRVKQQKNPGQKQLKLKTKEVIEQTVEKRYGKSKSSGRKEATATKWKGKQRQEESSGLPELVKGKDPKQKMLKEAEKGIDRSIDKLEQQLRQDVQDIQLVQAQQDEVEKLRDTKQSKGRKTNDKVKRKDSPKMEKLVDLVAVVEPLEKPSLIDEVATVQHNMKIEKPTRKCPRHQNTEESILQEQFDEIPIDVAKELWESTGSSGISSHEMTSFGSTLKDMRTRIANLQKLREELQKSQMQLENGEVDVERPVDTALVKVVHDLEALHTSLEELGTQLGIVEKVVEEL